jgi:hypothetical protein
MSLAQLVSQVAYLLGSTSRTPFTWPDSPNEPVLSRAFIGRLPANFSVRDTAAPFAIICPGQTTPNREHGESYLDEAVVTVALVARNENDQSGSGAMVGAVRAGQGSSVGKGLLDIEGAVLARLRASTNQVNGVPLGVQPTGTTVPPPEIPEEMRNTVAARAIEVTTVRVPTQPTFAQVRRLLASGSIGSVVLTWQALPDTYDLVSIQIVRKSGSTTPANPTDGTIIALGSLPPQAPSPTLALVETGGGVVTPGVHSFACAWVYHDDTESLLGPPVQVTADANTHAVTISVPNVTTLPVGAVGIAFYATLAGGSVYYLVNEVDAAPFTATLNYNDGALAGQPIYGTAYGPVPPPLAPGSTTYTDDPSSGTWSYSAFGVFDTTRDPITGMSVAKPDRYSGYVQALAGAAPTFVYLPASVTVTV